jgi:hypothetical protein
MCVLRLLEIKCGKWRGLSTVKKLEKAHSYLKDKMIKGGQHFLGDRQKEQLLSGISRGLTALQK